MPKYLAVQSSKYLASEPESTVALFRLFLALVEKKRGGGYVNSAVPGMKATIEIQFKTIDYCFPSHPYEHLFIESYDCVMQIMSNSFHLS